MLPLLTKIITKQPITHYSKYIYSTQRRLLNTTDSKIENAKNFTPIYEFPYIRILSTLNRLKIYHTLVTGLALPGSIALSQANLIPSESILITFSLGLSGCLVLYSLGYLTKDFIGFIYLNEEQNQLKVSSVDFWGRRKDEIVDIRDIVPLSDLSYALTDGMYFKLKRYSNEKTYWKINTNLGIVLDKEKFNQVIK